MSNDKWLDLFADETWVTCPDCEGSGEVAGDYFSIDNSQTCERCLGHGLVPPDLGHSDPDRDGYYE
jgi:DnaJ-class molecular chaperone